jgi:hypothetical protein
MAYESKTYEITVTYNNGLQIRFCYRGTGFSLDSVLGHGSYKGSNGVDTFIVKFIDVVASEIRCIPDAEYHVKLIVEKRGVRKQKP